MYHLFTATAALFLSVALLMVAGGLLGSLVGLRAAHEGFPVEVAGLMMSAFYAGLILGTLRCGALINRVGHIRAFGAFCGVNAAAVLAFPLLVDPWFWLALRVLIGFNMAGMYMVVESWLNSSAEGPTRGTLLAAYMAVSYLAMGSGQFMLTLGDLGGDTLFSLAGMLTALALVPLAVTRATHPAPVPDSRFGFRELYRLSPLAVIGCALAGVQVGALFGLGPIFAQQLGLALDEIAVFMGALVLSGLLLQLPLGRLSDHVDRRWVIVGAALVACLAGLLLLPVTAHYSFTSFTVSGAEVRVLWEQNPAPLLLVAALCGGTIATLYPLCVAYANDQVSAQDMVPASGGLVLAYGSGALLGPVGGALAMKLLGASGLFAFTAAAGALTALVALWRLRRGAPT
ncbi:MAG TPA: MFS transporter, partial [Gammaproteobacteria bacterium]